MFSNAIAWATIRHRGTWKNYAITTGGYALVIGGAFAFFTHTSGVSGMGALHTWSSILFFIQLLILVIGGCSAVGNAIRRDVTSGLIASHRLMPLSPAAAVAGYVVGPTTQVLLLAGVNVLVGVATAALAGFDVIQWLASNVAVLLFVLFMWVCVAFMGFLAKSAFGGLFGVLFASLTGSGIVVAFIPAMAVLLTPVIVSFTSAVGRGGALRLNVGFGYAIAGQLVFGAILYRGAMRRYRRDDVPALGTRLAFLLLGAWVVTSLVGVLCWNDLGIDLRNLVDVKVQAIAGTLSTIFIALVSVSASAKASTEWTRTTLTTGYAPGRRPVPPPALVLLAAALIFALALGLRPQYSEHHPERVALAFGDLRSTVSMLFALRVAVVAAVFLFAVSYLLRVIYRVSAKPIPLVGLWLVVTWLLPLGIQAGVDAIRKTPDRGEPIFSRMSPPGELAEIWAHPGRTTAVGIAVQVAMALVPAAMFYATEPRNVRAKPVG